MAVGNIVYSTSSTTIVSGQVINSSNFERSTNLQVDTTTGNLNIAGSVNAGGSIVASDIVASDIVASGTTNLGSVGSVKISGGSSGQVLTTDGSGNLSWSAGSLNIKEYLYISTTTWTAPAGVTRVRIMATSGGAGGGAASGFGNSGGYAGHSGFIIAEVPVTPGTTYTITIGAGGAGGLYGSGSGSSGGETWFGVNSSTKLISCPSGQGGIGAGASPGTNGTNATVTFDGSVTLIRSNPPSPATTGSTGSYLNSLFGGPGYVGGARDAKDFDRTSSWAPGATGAPGTTYNSGSGGVAGALLLTYVGV